MILGRETQLTGGENQCTWAAIILSVFFFLVPDYGNYISEQVLLNAQSKCFFLLHPFKTLSGTNFEEKEMKTSNESTLIEVCQTFTKALERAAF